ncbi:hypothetical protein D9758_006452 [Tetrapyrgos nigripes]|uniref:Uncharacterized protein n=1 Tax=Tetrapyrgos nigripes TaxID=182062 RepID=A0A8H5LRG6_9AGAR|nr:hypothetical protein D9758_006452 [Tetrapyrgos nigripes]
MLTSSVYACRFEFEVLNTVSRRMLFSIVRISGKARYSQLPKSGVAKSFVSVRLCLGSGTWMI